MPKSCVGGRSRRSASRRRMSLAGGSGAASYVIGMAGDGPAQYANVYQNPAHMNSPTGGGMWLNNGQNVAYQGGLGIGTMSGGRRRRRSMKGTMRRRRSSKKSQKSWFPKLF